MKRITNLGVKPTKTFFLGRACLYCGEPIEDQARSSKLHCSPWIDEYGVRHDCKRKRHHVKNHERESILLDFSANQREIARQIEQMIKAHGTEVTTEILEAYAINLFGGLRFEMNYEQGVAEFLGYKIITTTKTKTHKIIKG